MFSRVFFVATCIALLFNSLLMAAPIKTPTSLPLTGHDIALANNIFSNDKQIKDFVYFIKSIDVFPDHRNVKNIEQIEDKNKEKRFYIAPFFQASEERNVVGNQEIAEQGVKLISELYELVGAFDYELFRLNQITHELKKKTSALNNLKKNFDFLKDELSINTANELIKDLKQEIEILKNESDKIINIANKNIEETSTLLKKQVASQIQLKLSFLGVVATEKEQSQLKSASAAELRAGITSLIARAVGQGQFGFRSVTFESGFTEQQRKWISVYRRIRPDVHVASLPTKAIYARGTAMSANGNRAHADYFLDSSIISAPRLFLSINGGSAGKCGNTRSCNVVMEYTWLGATMAQSSRSGAVVMPVYFEADVTFAQPDFEGSISCDFVNGFKSTGRADVKDGAIIYDGDVYNEIQHEALENGSCSYKIEKGDADSAAYHTIKYIFDNYIKLKMQRAVKSRDEMNRYRSFITQELQYHANNSQNKNHDSWSLSTWFTNLGASWLGVATYAIEGARGFYWHTRVENSSVAERVKFTTQISEANVEKTERVAFDGFSIVCWKKDGMYRELAACPSQNISNYIEQSDTDLGKNRSLCGESAIDSTCMELTSPKETDEHGVLLDIWS